MCCLLQLFCIAQNDLCRVRYTLYCNYEGHCGVADIICSSVTLARLSPSKL